MSNSNNEIIPGMDNKDLAHQLKQQMSDTEAKMLEALQKATDHGIRNIIANLSS